MLKADDVSNNQPSTHAIVLIELSSAAFTNRWGGEIVLCRSWWTNPEKRLFKLTPPSPHRPSASLDEYVTQGVQLLHEVIVSVLWSFSSSADTDSDDTRFVRYR